MLDFYTENNQWILKNEKCKKVLIFDAKDNAEKIYNRWMRQPKIEGFIVSKRADNPYEIADKTVYTFDDIPLEERALYLLVFSQVYENIDKMKKVLDNAGFTNYCAIDQAISFESYWDKANLWCGGINKISEGKRKIDKELIKKKLCIYAVTSHCNSYEGILDAEENYIELIQAGAALTDIKVSRIRDDSGKNRSKENPQLCEMTAAYWIRHNDDEHDYVGLCHYSRVFNLSYGQIAEIFEGDYDIILPSPWIYYEQMIQNVHFSMYKAIEHVFPEDVLFAQKYLLDHVFFQGNLMIAKKEVYREAVDWIFKVLDGVKWVFDKDNMEMPPRCQAYISEHLTNIFILKNFERFKIGFVNVAYLYD